MLDGQGSQLAVPSGTQSRSRTPWWVWQHRDWAGLVMAVVALRVMLLIHHLNGDKKLAITNHTCVTVHLNV